MRFSVHCALLQGQRGTISKLLRIMKLTTIILLTVSLHVAARSEGQTVTLKEKNATLEKIFVEIRKQTGYNFFFGDGTLKNANRVTIDVHNVPVKEALQICFRNQPFDYTIEGTTIVVRSEPNKKKSGPGIELSATDTIPRVPVTGRVMLQDSSNAVLENVNVVNLATKVGTTTGSNGIFSILARKGDVLEFSYVGIMSKRLAVNNTENTIAVGLQREIKSETAVIIYNTGFEFVPKERATGSFVQVDNKLLNRSISTNIMDRLQDVTSGMLFLKGNTNVLDNIQVRGESTIAANRRPLVIVDNFEYEGNVEDINPNDVESITLLRDAAAASIWGAKAGNGVIVISLKKGRYNSKLKTNVVTNFSVGEKPDLFYRPTMSISDFIEVEKYLYDQDYYTGSIFSSSMPALTPVVEILAKRDAGIISADVAEKEINELKKFDVRNDYSKYLYQKSLNQQYAVNLTGGSNNNKYFVSLGYDRNRSNIVNNTYDRLTLNATNTYSLFNSRLEFTTGILFSHISDKQNGLLPSQLVFDGQPGTVYPYARFADENGNHLPIAQFRQDYIDTAGSGRLLDWQYRPLDEIANSDKKNRSISYRALVGITYKINKDIEVDIKYQYGRGVTEGKYYFNEHTYYTRNYINQFTRIDSTGTVIRPVPLGGILDLSNSTTISHNVRSQIIFNKTLNDNHFLNAIVGASIQDVTADFSTNRFYGYNNENAISIPVDNASQFQHYVTGNFIKIDDSKRIDGTTDRFIYYFGNASYNYDRRLTISASARKDASNLFGVNANQKWIPLWSIGGSWEISNESFYKLQPIPYLKVRATYGYNGNVNKNVTAFLVARLDGFPNRYNLPSGQIVTPPNPDLRWERMGVVNLGIDYGIFKNRLTGSVDFFMKKGRDLIGPAPLAPSTGLFNFIGNNSSIRTKGVDLRLNAVIINRKLFNWSLSLLYSTAKDEVVKYDLQPENNSDYVFSSRPVIGNPLSGIYSYRWAGLDSLGDPMIFLNKTPSKDYTAIVSSTDINDIIYHGSRIPRHFGAILNSFALGNLGLSFNISYKLGYYFRRNSISTNYASLASSLGHKDYELRWQKPGDEQFTTVPAILVFSDYNRDRLYTNSEILVERGDHIRLNDIQISYNVENGTKKKFPFSSCRINVYLSNLGILWRANDKHLDPDAEIAGPAIKTYSVGLQCTF